MVSHFTVSCSSVALMKRWGSLSCPIVHFVPSTGTLGSREVRIELCHSSGGNRVEWANVVRAKELQLSPFTLNG